MKTIEMKRTLSILCLLSFSLFMNGQQATGYTKTRNYTAERTYMDAMNEYSDADIKQKQEELSALYDGYTAKFGTFPL